MENSKTKSPELLQSMTMTRSGVSFTKTQKQFLYEIIARVQSMYQGIKVRDAGTVPFDPVDASATTFVIPISDIIDYSNRKHLKDSLQEMFYKMILIGDDEKGWSVKSFFDSIEIPDGQGVIKARMTLTFFETMANLTHGMSVFDYHVAKGLPSPYTMKMYEFISRWDRNPPRTIQMEELREILGLNERKKNGSGEIEVVRKFDSSTNVGLLLKRIKEDLEDPQYQSPYTFDFVPIKEGRKVIKYLITVYKDEELDNEREKKKKYDAEHDSLSLEISRELHDFMIRTLEWDDIIIRKNLHTLKAYQKYFGAAELRMELSSLHSRSKRDGIDNPVGYIVGGLKGKLRHKGITVGADGEINIDEAKRKGAVSLERSQLFFDEIARKIGRG